MKIGELASKAGCDVQTVRYYEREGLLEAPEREASGYRRYVDKHLTRLQFIRHCRALDIPLAEVRQLLDYAQAPRQSCHAVDALLDEHIERVRRQLSRPDNAGAPTRRAAPSGQRREQQTLMRHHRLVHERASKNFCACHPQ